jgi:Rieske Fe-S protein
VSQPEQFPTPTPGPTPGPTSTQDLDRRTVIRNAGVVGAAVVGAATLAACGGSSDTATTAGTPAAGAGSSAAPAGGTIKVADIPVGGGKVFDAEKVVVTQPKAGEFKAFDATCTHKGCTVAAVANGTINCPCHGSKFNMATGAVVSGPATAPLPGKKATVSGGSITVA